MYLKSFPGLLQQNHIMLLSLLISFSSLFPQRKGVWNGLPLICESSLKLYITVTRNDP